MVASRADRDGARIFSPAFYIEPFKDLGVATVVHLDTLPCTRPAPTPRRQRTILRLSPSLRDAHPHPPTRLLHVLVDRSDPPPSRPAKQLPQHLGSLLPAPPRCPSPLLRMQLQPPGARHLRDSGPRGRASFQEAGFRAEDARIERLAPPPLDAVRRFFRACDADGDGAVAAHCRTGRGRTAVVAALWLMREHGFTALEATVWLRLVRPGPAARPPHGPPLASPGPPCPGKAG